MNNVSEWSVLLQDDLIEQSAQALLEVASEEEDILRDGISDVRIVDIRLENLQ